MICTRFAPSPTGFLHVGGARTALFSWLYAKRHEGQFILRIEDTDLERSTPEAVQAILDGMNWLGLNYDAGPYYQTKRFPRYQEVIDQMLKAGTAYRCYCSKERLETLRETQMANKEKPRYDGHCFGQAEQKDKPFVVRFRNPETGSVIFDDFIRGHIEVQNKELDDLIIARSDGSPTYNFCVVIDDWDMKVTHVIRGDDHINNTPRQINIFHALNATPPVYGHVPMILGSDGKKLSKRHGAVSVMQYRDDGFLPQALLNYLVRLGWSSGDQEIFSVNEMIKLFDAKNISKSAATFNPEKLLWLNQHYLKTLPVEEIEKHLRWHIEQIGLDTNKGPTLKDVILAFRERAKTLKEMAEGCRYFYEEVNYSDEAAEKNLKANLVEPLTRLQQGFIRLPTWTEESVQHVITAVAEALDVKMGKIAQPLRFAVTGMTISPPLGAVLALLGREKVLQRLDKALEYCRTQVE